MLDASRRRGSNHHVDGNRTSLIEHAVHVLLLPNLHTLVHRCVHPGSQDNPVTGTTPNSPYPSLCLPLPFLGPVVPGWTPLHVQLRVLTRLSFNESGRVTYHRDFVDVKDLFSLVPGFTAVQWFCSTLAARLLSGVSSVLLHGPEIVTEDSSTDDDA